MRFSPLLLSLFLVNPVRAQTRNDTSDALSMVIEKLPPCALKCTMSAVGNSTCDLTDFSCITSDKPLFDEITLCTKQNCSIRNTLTTRKILANLLNEPTRNVSQTAIHIYAVLGSFALLSYILRVMSRVPPFGSNWGVDDWVITAATIIIIAGTICAGSLDAIGRDLWEVPFDELTKTLKIFYFLELLYLWSISLTKIAILIFYLRIFPGRRLRQAIYTTITLTILYMVVISSLSAFQCRPLSLTWTRWDGEQPGECNDMHNSALSNAAINIVIDLIVMFLPVKEIIHLSLGWRQKAGIMAMFALGSFTTLISGLRIKYLVQYNETDNITWDHLSITLWSVVETQIGLIVACMPAIRALQRSIQNRYWPKPATVASHYELSARSGSHKNSHNNSCSRNWGSTFDNTHLRTGNRNKEDFMELGECETEGDVSPDGARSGKHSSSWSVSKLYRA